MIDLDQITRENEDLKLFARRVRQHGIPGFQQWHVELVAAAPEVIDELVKEIERLNGLLWEWEQSGK